MGVDGGAGLIDGDFRVELLGWGCILSTRSGRPLFTERIYRCFYGSGWQSVRVRATVALLIYDREATWGRKLTKNEGQS